MSQQLEALRHQMLRRSRCATNTRALLGKRVPPEWPFHAELINGLLAIVADQWPGAGLLKYGQAQVGTLATGSGRGERAVVRSGTSTFRSSATGST